MEALRSDLINVIKKSNDPKVRLSVVGCSIEGMVFFTVLNIDYIVNRLMLPNP